MPSHKYRTSEDAVRDTVKVARSQTSFPINNKPLPQPVGRRSQSTDSYSPEKVKQPTPKSTKPKKGSQHADVIDRLDFTGVGPMFHHDGPFDACAPSRNRQKSKAPMMAWAARPDDPILHANSDSPYGGSHAYDVFSNDDYEAPKKKVDAIAEAWGTHEPEPFEEFFAGGGARGDTPASSIYNGKDRSTNRRIPKDSPRSSKEESPRSRAPRRNNLPPPQPIFIADNGVIDNSAANGGGGSPTAAGAPKRSKSLMHRIRRMRDSPNVPVGDYAEAGVTTPPAVERDAGRPGHRTHQSYNVPNTRRPTRDPVSEPYVVIDATTNKDLPATPMPSAADQDYFARSYSTGQAASPGGNGLGRKPSLMQKMGRVVRGGRA